MKPAIRDRLLLPILLPLGILVLIVAALYGFSRILLSLPAAAATATALTVATGILVASAVAASRRRVRLSTIAAMLGATAGVAMLAGGIALAIAPGEEHEGEGEGEAPGPGLLVVAQDIAFDTATISLPAGQPSTITLENRDAGVQHNIGIYTDSSLATELFDGELITGPVSVDYEIPALDAGEHYFLCIVHPNMNGTVIVSSPGEGEGRPGGEEPTGPTGEPAGTAEPSTVIAQGNAFDTATISLPAGQPSTITLDNRDAGVQHNIMITTDSSLSTQLFNGELITGPTTIKYELPASEAGEYYFLCLVHPNMNGTVTVA